jgi:hypothetical protein
MLLVYANTYVVNLDEQIFESHLTTNCEHDSTITKFTHVQLHMHTRVILRSVCITVLIEKLLSIEVVCRKQI